MSTPYGGNDPQQWGQGPQYGQQPSQPQWGQPQAQPPQWGQQPPAQPQYGQQPGYPPSGPTQQPGQPQYGGPTQQPGQPGQWGQQPGQPQPGQPQPGQPQYGQQPGGGYPATGPTPQQSGPWGQPSAGGQYDYNQPPGFAGGEQAKRKSNKGLIFGVGGLVVVVIIAAVLLFLWPGFLNTKVFDNTAMGNDVKTLLTDNYKVQGVDSVTCPANQEVTAGTTFDCTATIGGQPQRVTITVKDDSGNYVVDAPKP